MVRELGRGGHEDAAERGFYQGNLRCGAYQRCGGARNCRGAPARGGRDVDRKEAGVRFGGGGGGEGEDGRGRVGGEEGKHLRGK